MGRPRKSEAESIRRGVHLRMRLPRELHGQIEAQAADEGMTVPTWVMRQCRASLRSISGASRRGSAPHEAQG